MATVVVTGASGMLGRRVAARLAGSGDRVVGIDRRPPAEPAGAGRFQVLDVADPDADLKALFEGADCVVHLAHDHGAHDPDDQRARHNAEAAGRVLDAAAAASVPGVVLVSSAAVYGAWANSPVPLTEEAPLRPNPRFAFALEKAEVERLAAELRAAHPGLAVAVLRPAPTVAEGEASWLAAVLRESAMIRTGTDRAPVQYLHVDDLAAAVELAARRRLDGAFNVAPEGWLSDEQVRALAGLTPRVRLPERVANRVRRWAREVGLTAVPPGFQPYLVAPWVVAADRLRAEGWSPVHSNEQAFVAGHEASPWTEMSPKRRQEVALAAMVAALGGTAAGVVALVRRRRA